MKTFLVATLALLLSSCAGLQQQASQPPTVNRSIASEVQADGIILVTGYHNGRYHALPVEDLNDALPSYLKDTFGIDDINFKVINSTPDANGKIRFSFEISRANAAKIVESAVKDLRTPEAGVQRSREQRERLQRITECMISNYTVANFLNEVSASDQFQFVFELPQSMRIINLQTGAPDPVKPTCDRWAPTEAFE